MSKRYGRNQKRAHKARIAALEETVRKISGAAMFAKHSYTKVHGEGWVYEYCARVLNGVLDYIRFERRNRAHVRRDSVLFLGQQQRKAMYALHPGDTLYPVETDGRIVFAGYPVVFVHEASFVRLG